MLSPAAIEVGELRRPVDEQVAVELLADAFLDFPAMQVLVGDDDGAHLRLRRLFAMEFDVDSSVEALGARLQGRLVGVLTYLDSPGCSAVTSGRLFHFIRLAGPRVVSAMRMFGRIERAHLPAPHRHLPTVGVAPSFQSRGVGRALMEAFNERCDAEGKVAYLETIRWSDPTRPSHERFYGRLGYVVTGVVPMTEEWEVLTMARPKRGAVTI